MSDETVHGGGWTGLRARFMAWYMYSLSNPLLLLGDSRPRVLFETEAALKGEGTVLDVAAGSGHFKPGGSSDTGPGQGHLPGLPGDVAPSASGSREGGPGVQGVDAGGKRLQDTAG